MNHHQHQQQQQYDEEQRGDVNHSMLSPVDVVRRNRQKRLMEQQLSRCNNDVWNLNPKEENEEIKEQGLSDKHSAGFSKILRTEQQNRSDQRRRKKEEQYEQYRETQFGHDFIYLLSTVF